MQRATLRAIRAFILRRWVHPLSNLAVKLTAKQEGWVRDGLIKAVVIASQLGRLVMTMLRVNVKRLGGSDWSVIYIGEEFSLEELRHVLFPSPASVDHLGRIFLWRVPGLVRQFVNDGEFVVCELNRLVPWRPRAGYVFTATPWVRQILDIARPLDDILAGMNQNMRRNIRKLEKAGFSYRFTREPADLDLFYHQMYVPYITSRHEARAIVAKYYEIEYTLDKGGLIMVEYQGQPVSGMGCKVLGDACRADVLGVHKDRFDLANKGAIASVFWFMLDWAQGKGLRSFDLGGSRARLADGVFNFKRQWGTQLSAPLTMHTAWTFVAERIPADLCRFINAQGFLGQLDGQWRVAMFETPEVQLSNEEIEHARQMAQRAGAADVQILRYPEARSVASSAFQSVRS
ncbi:MAG: GNAT family N-acetyltransferase [Anaerolineae bacterium]|jgi:hypothetical protein